MVIRIQCPGCAKTLNAKDSFAGKRVKCPACQALLEIPASGSASTTPAERESQGDAFLYFREPRLVAADAALQAKLLQALDASRFEEAAAILARTSLWMVSAPGDEDLQPLVADLEELEALVVFTSEAFVQQFAAAAPEVAQQDGSIQFFAVDGPNVFAQLHGDIGVLVNPESDEAFLLDADCIEVIQRHLSDPSWVSPTVQVSVPYADQGVTEGDPQAVEIRNEALSELNELGFFPATWMPLADLGRAVRPESEIAGRLLALAAVFAWVSAPEDAIPDGQLKAFVKRSKLGHWANDSEREMLSLSRRRANAQFADVIGWRLENMWPLAWVLGYERQPDVGVTQIGEDVIHSMLFDFIGGFDASVESLLKTSNVRTSVCVSRLEDYFYCAHNAVRTAQLGSSESPVVPTEFDPIAQGGVVHERRHALTWCLSPGVAWDETDLST